MVRDSLEIRSLIQSGYRYALSLTHHQHDAEDLIQQACVRVLRSRGHLVSRPYLFAAVRNLYIDQRRRAANRSVQTLQLVEDIPSPADHEQLTDDRMEIQCLLARLRPEEREALYLNCVEGFSAREIAELTDSPRGTVLSLLSRAKTKLAETANRSANPENTQ